MLLMLFTGFTEKNDAYSTEHANNNHNRPGGYLPDGGKQHCEDSGHRGSVLHHLLVS